MPTVLCSVSSCQLTVQKHMGLPTQNRVCSPVNAATRPAEWSRGQCWRRRTGQRGGGETAWSVRTQQWTGCCCPADTPVSVTAACLTSSTALSVGPTSWSPSPWHRNQLWHTDSVLNQGMLQKSVHPSRKSSMQNNSSASVNVVYISSTSLLCIYSSQLWTSPTENVQSLPTDRRKTEVSVDSLSSCSFSLEGSIDVLLTRILGSWLETSSYWTKGVIKDLSPTSLDSEGIPVGNLTAAFLSLEFA